MAALMLWPHWPRAVAVLAGPGGRVLGVLAVCWPCWWRAGCPAGRACWWLAWWPVVAGGRAGALGARCSVLWPRWWLMLAVAASALAGVRVAKLACTHYCMETQEPP